MERRMWNCERGVDPGRDDVPCASSYHEDEDGCLARKSRDGRRKMKKPLEDDLDGLEEEVRGGVVEEEEMGIRASSGLDSTLDREVVELRGADSRKCLDDLENGAYAPDESTGRGTSSRSRSVQNRFTQYDGNASGSSSPPDFQWSTAGPRGMHGNIVQGAKKNLVSANHLLNFCYVPIQRPQPRMPPMKRQQKVRPFNRDLFLQANYNFVLLDTGHYVVESMDPDKMLQWEDVVCVQFYTPSAVQCPICLETPLCPQISSCGHIYCFPCILRYLLMGEENHNGESWKKCPLCFMMISLNDLHTIYINLVKQFDIGDHAHFTLMTRQKDSFVPIQMNETGPSLTSEKDQISSFSKFMLTSDVEMSVREAKSNLNEWLAKAKSGLVDDLEKLPYVCAALEQLEQRAKGWAEHQTVSDLTMNRRVSQAPTKVLPRDSDVKDISANTAAKEAWGSASERNKSIMPNVLNSEKIGAKGSLPADNATHSGNLGKVLPIDNKGTDQRLSGGSKDSGNKGAYVFYQVIDGQHIILHPLNMKCLLYHYKSSEFLPPRISGKILQLESVTQSEASRRRYRFLSHFSLTTSFQLCEIDLREMLPVDAFSPFLDEIKQREKQRKLVARKERESKARSKATDPCSRTVPTYNETCVKDLAFKLDEFEALGSSITPSPSPSVTGDKKLFSDVARLGFAAAHDSPSLGADGSSNYSSIKSKVSSTTGPSTPTLSFANILSTEKIIASQDAPKASTSEKKGKKSTRVLLSTSGGRRY